MLVVPGRPAAKALLWWVLGDAEAAPSVTLSGPGASQSHVVCRQLGNASDPLMARRVYVVAATDLQEDATYTLEAVTGHNRAQAAARTLPQALTPLHPFTIAIGSCFSLPQDRGINAFYPPAPHRDGSPDPIRLRVLCGDQIYMDLSPTSGSPLVFDAPEPWQHYHEQWHNAPYAAFLGKSPTLMLADDHEFWNDYPHGNAWLLWDESQPGGPLGGTMTRAFEVFQAALNLDPVAVAATDQAHLGELLRETTRTFEVRVDPLRLFCFDTRTARSRYDAQHPHFAPSAWLASANAWLREPGGARVLCLSQPAIEKRASWLARTTHTLADANLPDYDDDFAALWEALVSAPADRLVVSGDIHWSRLYQARRAGAARADVYEAIASPLARIPSSAPDTGKPEGKVEWDQPGGRAAWTRRYATDAEATYTTLTFRVRSGGTQPDVEVQATAWGIPRSRGQGAIPLCQDTFTLRGVV